MKLDLACGKNKQKGFKGVDIIPGPEIDFVWDLEKFPWEPFADDSAEEIHCGRYIGYAPDLIKFMDEIWRICQDDAKVTILTPYITSVAAWSNPKFHHVLCESSFNYFNKEWRIREKLTYYPIKSNFVMTKIFAFFNPPWDKKPEEARQFAQAHYWNACSLMFVELRTVKS
jgi:hypothetical protein